MPTGHKINRNWIRAALAERNLTAKDVMAEFNCTYPRAYQALRRAHAAGDCHIGAWAIHSAGGKPIGVYIAGPGEDAQHPEVLSDAERLKRYRYRNAWGRTPAQIDRELEARIGKLREAYERDVEKLRKAATLAKRVITRKRRAAPETIVPYANRGLPTLAQQLAATK